MKSIKITALDIVVFLLAVVLAVAVVTVAGPCIHEDGTHGSCHYVGVGIFVAALTLAVQGLISIFSYSRRMKVGVSAGIVPVALATAVLPLVLREQLCGVATMRCRMLMSPAAMVLGGLIALCALINAIRQYIHVIHRERHGS